jgi:glutamyl-tRNA reductase
LNVPKSSKRSDKAAKTIPPAERGPKSRQQPAEPAATADALLRKAEAIRKAQLDLTLKKLRGLTQAQRDSLDAMTRALVEEILHEPLGRVGGCNDEGESYAEIVRQLFHLDPAESGEPGTQDA